MKTILTQIDSYELPDVKMEEDNSGVGEFKGIKERTSEWKKVHLMLMEIGLLSKCKAVERESDKGYLTCNSHSVVSKISKIQKIPKCSCNRH